VERKREGDLESSGDGFGVELQLEKVVGKASEPISERGHPKQIDLGEGVTTLLKAGISSSNELSGLRIQ